MIRSKDQSDIRQYTLKFTVYPKPVRAKIEMRCSAGEVITQKIPIINPTKKPWILQIQFHNKIDENSWWFQGDHDLSIPQGETGYY